MNEITILHLSDIHFKRKKDDDNKTFRQAVQQRLMEAVTAHLKQHGNPDFVVITGDIAFSGKKEEYDEALTFLSGLKTVLPKETEFLVVPGNHDVDREQINKFFSLYQIIKNEKIDKFLESPEDVYAHINVKFKAYREFIDRLNPGLYQSKEDYYWVKNCKKKNVAFLGLNSAWACEGDDDPLHVALGFPQVMAALDRTEGIANKILLLHHPLSNCFNLKDSNKWIGEIFDKCRLILHGHVHFDNALALNTPSASCIYIGANAAYTHDGVIGFQFINVCFEEDRTGVRVWPYKLETREKPVFLPDTSRWKGQQGRAYFNIETRDASVEKYPPLQIPADIKIIVDGKVIKQIEKLIGETLQFLPLKNIMKLDNNGYSLNNAGQIQGLNLDSRKVDDISFLSSLVGLTHLSLEDNQITDVTPLGLLTNLTNLNLKKNQIKDLTPLRELKNLTVLNLHENEITDITPLQDMEKLEELYLSKNKIIKIAVFSSFKNLKRLGLGDCQIADPALTQLSTLTNLETLALYENQITDITPLKALTKLTKLWLNSNQITDPTPLSALTKLTELDLRNNQITSLKPLNPLTMLTTLILERNQITDLMPLRELKNLGVLNLSKNKITDITPLQDMEKLTELYLSKNKITKFTVLCSFKNLKRLGLGNSGITDFAITLLSDLTNLEKLALYENQITDITPLRELKNLIALDVRRNRIEKLPPEIITWWPNLEIKWVDDFIPGLILLDNPLTDPPVEIVKKGKAAVKKYFDSLGDSQSSIENNNFMAQFIFSNEDKTIDILKNSQFETAENNELFIYLLEHFNTIFKSDNKTFKKNTITFFETYITNSSKKEIFAEKFFRIYLKELEKSPNSSYKELLGIFVPLYENTSNELFEEELVTSLKYNFNYYDLENSLTELIEPIWKYLSDKTQFNLVKRYILFFIDSNRGDKYPQKRFAKHIINIKEYPRLKEAVESIIHDEYSKIKDEDEAPENEIIIIYKPLKDRLGLKNKEEWGDFVRNSIEKSRATSAGKCFITKPDDFLGDSQS